MNDPPVIVHRSTATQCFINSSTILYVEPNKKRTDTWLTQNGLQLPKALTKYGPIRSVSLVAKDGKGNYSFGDDSPSESAFTRAMRIAEVTHQ